MTLGGTFAGTAVPAARVAMEDRGMNDDVIMLGHPQTSMTNAKKLVQKLDTPLSNNTAAWKGRAASMKGFYEGMDK
eukprot:800496-Pyramimonas_sp.AAC.1